MSTTLLAYKSTLVKNVNKKLKYEFFVTTIKTKRRNKNLSLILVLLEVIPHNGQWISNHWGQHVL